MEEVEMSNNNGTFSAFLAGTFVGGLAGAAAALLLAPQGGEETREQIRQRSIKLQGRAEATLNDARARIEEVAVDVRQRAEELQTQSKVILEESQKQLAQAIEETKKAAATATVEPEKAA
jgi:gas vesicle protein